MRLMRLLILLAVLAAPSTASAAELMMFRRDGCPYCAAWDRDIGPVYGKTEVGRRAPLRMVDIRRDRPEVVLKRRVIYTPTFVLVEAGREVGRLEGYTGDHFFWSLLDKLIKQLPAMAPQDQRAELSR